MKDHSTWPHSVLAGDKREGEKMGELNRSEAKVSPEKRREETGGLRQ